MGKSFLFADDDAGCIRAGSGNGIPSNIYDGVTDIWSCLSLCQDNDDTLNCTGVTFDLDTLICHTYAATPFVVTDSTSGVNNISVSAVCGKKNNSYFYFRSFSYDSCALSYRLRLHEHFIYANYERVTKIRESYGCV